MAGNAGRSKVLHRRGSCSGTRDRLGWGVEYIGRMALPGAMATALGGHVGIPVSVLEFEDLGLACN